MKRTLIITAAAIAPFCLMYLITAFAYLSVDPRAWGVDGRGFVAVLGAFFGPFAAWFAAALTSEA